MQSNTIALAGCQKSTQIVIMTALKNAGFKVFYLPYDVRYLSDTIPDCLLIDLQGDDVFKARPLIDHPSLKETKKLLMLDTRDQKARQFIASANVDDILFKPLQIDELVSRLHALLKKNAAQHGYMTELNDEFSFAQFIQDLETRRFTGCLKFQGEHLEGELHLNGGRVNGARIGQKLQSIALTALWRLFPTKPELIPNAPVPDWSNPPLNINAEQVIGNIAHASSEFRSIFPKGQGLDTIYKLNSTVYEAAFHTLPRQVRRLVQTFDGDRTLNDIFSYINLDEFVLMQILRRLLDEHLIIEVQQNDNSGQLSLVDWIRGVSDTEDADDLTAEKTVRMPSPLQQPPREEKTALLPPPRPKPTHANMPPMPERPTNPMGHAVPKLPMETGELPDHTTHSILMYAFPSQIPQDPSIDPDKDEDKPFRAEPVIRKQFSREVVEQKLRKSPPTLIVSDHLLRRGQYYSDSQLLEEDDREKTHAKASPLSGIHETIGREGSKCATAIASSPFENEVTRISATHQLTPDNPAEIQAPPPKKPSKPPVTEPKTPESTQLIAPNPEKDPLEAKREHLMEMQELYEKSHSEELSKEEWREQTITRLNRENAEANAKFKRNLALLILLFVLAIALIVVLTTGTSSTKQPAIIASKPHDTPQLDLATSGLNEIDTPQAAQESPQNEPAPEVTQQPLPDDDIEIGEPLNAETQENSEEQQDTSAETQVAEQAPAQPVAAPTPVVPKPVATKPAKNSKEAAEKISKFLQSTRTEMSAKNWNAAQKQVEQALAIDSKHPIANVLAGQIQAKLGNFNKAINYYKTAEKANANKSVYWVQLSEYYRAVGDFKASDNAIDRAIAILGSASPEGRKLAMQKSSL